MLSGLIPVSGFLLSSWEGGAQKGLEEWWGLNWVQHSPPVALTVPSYLPHASVSPSLDVDEVCVKHGDQYLAQSGHSANMSW